MNLLPKSHKEFSEKDYWNKFFKKRGNKSFEWYGEYIELCGQLHKYMKPKDKILVPGCGNSKLSADLYDVGYRNIINIDVSEVVVKQMKNTNVTRREMKFLCMDAMNMTFDDGQFTVVLDKGTLDALMPDDSEETNKNIDKYFGEIKRVLKLGGRFVCISLLQSHILAKLLKSFCDRSWMFRVVRCHEAEERNAETGDGMSLPVFIVIITKFKEMPMLLLEVCLAGEKMVRVASPEELQTQIKSAQDTALITHGLSKTSIDGENEVSLDLVQPGELSPRYSLTVVDQQNTYTANKYAVFIVPQGRESEWLFGTPAGRRQIQDSAKFGRLVVAVLHRGHKFESLDAVKEELTHIAKMLIPIGFCGQIPFLSIGSDVGSRVTVHTGHSELTGDYVIEDVDVEGDFFRRLIFLDNQMLVQSEAKLKRVNGVDNPRWAVDFGFISIYHTFMCAGVGAAHDVTRPYDATRAAVLGLGGGGLCMFLRKCYDDVMITAVDIDPAMLEVARDHFELTTDKHLQVVIKDGLDYLREEAEKGTKLDVVLYDMDNKDRSLGLSCPPRAFLADDALHNVTALIGDTGHFILNLVCRDTHLYRTIMSKLRSHFKHIVSVKLYEDVNEIIFATNGSKKYDKEQLEIAARNLNFTARTRGLVPVKCVDLKDFVQSLTIIA